MNNILDFFGTIVRSSYFQTIVSAFFGGLFAGLFSNYFESRRRVQDIRRDKYYEHRNTIVQLEHELLPARINLSRDIASLKDSKQNTVDSNKRIVLRFFKLTLSPNLSLKLLNLDLINLYARVFEQFEIINNDIDYINQIVIKIIDNYKSNQNDENLINQYFSFSEYLLSEIILTDNLSRELLSYCKVIISKDEKVILKKYIEVGGEIKYNISKKVINKTSRSIIHEETRPSKKGEVQPKFTTPFLDLRRVLYTTQM